MTNIAADSADRLAEALATLLADIRPVDRNEPFTRMIPTQHSVFVIQFARDALKKYDSEKHGQK